MAKTIKTFLAFQEHQLPACFRNWEIEETEDMPTHPVSTEKYILVSPTNLQGNKEFLEYVEKMSLDELFQMIVNLGRSQLWKALDHWLEYNTPKLNDHGVIVYNRVKAPDLGIVDKIPAGMRIWERFAIEKSVLDYLLNKYATLTAESNERVLANYLQGSIDYTQSRMTAAGVNMPKPVFLNIFTYNKVEPMSLSQWETMVKGSDEELTKELLGRISTNLEKCGFVIEQPVAA